MSELMNPKIFIEACIAFNKEHGLKVKIKKPTKTSNVQDAEDAIDALEPLIVEGNSVLTDGYNELFDIWEKRFEGVDKTATELPDKGPGGTIPTGKEDGNPGPGVNDTKPPANATTPDANQQIAAVKKEEKAAALKLKREATAAAKLAAAKLIDPKEACIIDMFNVMDKKAIHELKPGSMEIVLDVLKK